MRKELIVLLILCSVFLAVGCTDTDDEDVEPIEEGTPTQGIAEVTEIAGETPVEAITPVESVTSVENETEAEDEAEIEDETVIGNETSIEDETPEGDAADQNGVIRVTPDQDY